MRLQAYGVLHHTRNAWFPPSISHSTEKCNKTLCMGWSWVIGTHNFPRILVIFPIRFTSYDILHMGNAWVSQSFFHNTRNCNKTHCMGWTWESSAHTIPILWTLFSIRFQIYGILHHMRNACVFSLISHNLGKDTQTHWMGKVWEIVTHTFPIVWVFFSH